MTQNLSCNNKTLGFFSASITLPCRGLADSCFTRHLSKFNKLHPEVVWSDWHITATRYSTWTLQNCSAVHGQTSICCAGTLTAKLKYLKEASIAQQNTAHSITYTSAGSTSTKEKEKNVSCTLKRRKVWQNMCQNSVFSPGSAHRWYSIFSPWQYVKHCYKNKFNNNNEQTMKLAIIINKYLKSKKNYLVSLCGV